LTLSGDPLLRSLSIEFMAFNCFAESDSRILFNECEEIIGGWSRDSFNAGDGHSSEGSLGFTSSFLTDYSVGAS